jgi:hypothetical protein
MALLPPWSPDGDLSNDSHLDIVVANYGIHNIRIFLGFENGSFMRQLVVSTNSSCPIWISLVDFNNDKIFDIATVNYGTDSISTFFGFGYGTFSNSITYSMDYDSLPSALAVGDFNNDDYLDIAIANYGTNNIDILLSYSDGTFTKSITISTASASHPHSIAVAYFNNDTLLDIALANYGTNSIGVFLSKANRTFANETTYSIGSSSPYSIGVGDFNQDNRSDLAVINKDPDNIGLLLGYGNGLFVNPRMNSTGSSSSISMAICDFNKDNQLDIIIANNDTGRIDIVRGYFEGSSYPTAYSSGTLPRFIAVADFNSDDQLDMVVANFYSNTISVLFGNDDGSFANQTTYVTGSAPRSVVVGDF